MKIVIKITGDTYKGQRTRLNKEMRKRIMYEIDQSLDNLMEFYPLDIKREIRLK